MLHNQAEEDKDSEQETERLAGERVHSHGLPSEKNLSGCPNVSREELHRPAAEWPSFHRTANITLEGREGELKADSKGPFFFATDGPNPSYIPPCTSGNAAPKTSKEEKTQLGYPNFRE